MERLYESVVRRLLAESKVDTFSRLIVRRIVQLIIERVEKLNARKKLIVGFQNQDFSGAEVTLKLTVLLKQRAANRVNVAGSWIPALDVLEVNVFFETEDGLFDKALLSQLQQRLYDTVRHEVEHSKQEKPADMYTDEEDEEESSPKSLWQDLKRIEEYFLSDHEVPAFVAGLYHQAKRSRRPFIEVMDSKLADYEAVAEHYNGGGSAKLRRLFKKIRRTWIEYAKQRFPKAVVA